MLTRMPNPYELSMPALDSERVGRFLTTIQKSFKLLLGSQGNEMAILKNMSTSSSIYL